MQFPKSKMQIVTVYDGKESQDGWLVLDFAKVDTEGISKIYVDLSDVMDLQKKKGEQADLMDQLKGLLSSDDE